MSYKRHIGWILVWRINSLTSWPRFDLILSGNFLRPEGLWCHNHLQHFFKSGKCVNCIVTSGYCTRPERVGLLDNVSRIMILPHLVNKPVLENLALLRKMYILYKLNYMLRKTINYKLQTQLFSKHLFFFFRWVMFSIRKEKKRKKASIGLI